MRKILTALGVTLLVLFIALVASAKLNPAYGQTVITSPCTYSGSDGNGRDCGVTASYSPFKSTTTNTPTTITAANTSQVALAANPQRRWLMCQNPTGATENLFINLGSAAGTSNGSFELAPGGALTMSNVVYTGAVYASAALAGKYFVCKEGY